MILVALPAPPNVSHILEGVKHMYEKRLSLVRWSTNWASRGGFVVADLNGTHSVYSQMKLFWSGEYIALTRPGLYTIFTGPDIGTLEPDC